MKAQEGAFTLEPDADAFDVWAGRPSSLTGLVEASRARRERGDPVRWELPLCEALVHRLEGLFSLARFEGCDVRLVRPEAPAALGPEARRFAWDFVRYRLLEAEAPLLSGEERRACEGLLAELADGRSHPLPGEGWGARAAEVGEVVFDGLRGLARWAGAQASPTPASAACASLPAALLIGAYGGDHIGDAAILGGVLGRLYARHGTRSAVLLSQRPDHTRHLVAMLEVPVALRVEPYEHAVVRSELARADALVFAGGPVTDIPKQLVRHLFAASLARSAGKPFLVEGVGVGPFERPPSEWVARRVLRLAGRISVRTREDAAQPQVRALAPELSRDPAFDYLETRGAELTRLPEVDRAWHERLLAGSEGRPRVGINVRPIDALFTAGTAGSGDAESHTRAVEDRFVAELARGMRRFHDACDRKPCFVFYPMNAIQFGRSDLHSAARIAREVGADVDFRVWQGDASVDGVVGLLRRLDAAIAMRFHGAIYALSQQLPVVGVDYRPGAKDKVAYLLEDFGRAEDCSRIDTLSGDWLAERLAAACGPGAAGGARG